MISGTFPQGNFVRRLWQLQGAFTEEMSFSDKRFLAFV
jgi:hypothetical protein